MPKKVEASEAEKARAKEEGPQCQHCDKCWEIVCGTVDKGFQCRAYPPQRVNDHGHGIWPWVHPTDGCDLFINMDEQRRGISRR